MLSSGQHTVVALRNLAVVPEGQAMDIPAGNRVDVSPDYRVEEFGAVNGCREGGVIFFGSENMVCCP